MIMETLKFKVGDKVRVKSLEWYNSNKDVNGLVYQDEQGIVFDKTMAKYCGEIVQIEEVNNRGYFVNKNIGFFEDWMLEDEVVEDIKKRVLTKEVAQAVVRCTKYLIKNKNENANLQKKLFEIGCKWASGSENVMYEDCKYLYVDNILNIKMGEDVEEENFYMNEPSAELSVNDVLNIEIKDMEVETKEMTKAEVFAYLGSTKIICTSNEETTKVQEKLFELGVEWMLQGKKVSEDKYLLFINNRQKLQHCSDIDYWIKDVNRRIEPSEILAIQIKEPKPKFDTKSLQAFDKVLVRENGGIWLARFFDIYEGGYFVTSGTHWTYCIPYNEETKHLHGTTDEAPEFYRI